MNGEPVRHIHIREKGGRPAVRRPVAGAPGPPPWHPQNPTSCERAGALELQKSRASPPSPTRQLGRPTAQSAAARTLATGRAALAGHSADPTGARSSRARAAAGTQGGAATSRSGATRCRMKRGKRKETGVARRSYWHAGCTYLALQRSPWAMGVHEPIRVAAIRTSLHLREPWCRPRVCVRVLPGGGLGVALLPAVELYDFYSSKVVECDVTSSAVYASSTSSDRRRRPRKIAVIFYNTLRHGAAYVDRGVDDHEERYRRRTPTICGVEPSRSDSNS